eukprot:2086180-Heterocapsa_arctica.AAC.1
MITLLGMLAHAVLAAVRGAAREGLPVIYITDDRKPTSHAIDRCGAPHRAGHGDEQHQRGDS